MIAIEEALEIILDNITEGPAVVVDTRDALGLVLAADIESRGDIPPFTNSAMDGYAVRSSDTRGASRENPVTLAVIEDVPAGTVPSKTVPPGGATKIMTGAPLPEGADAVIIVEETEERLGGVVCFTAVSPGQNVRPAGEDVKKGELLLPRGTVIRPAEMGMLAAAGATRVKVVAAPRVALLATGSELVEADRTPGPGQLRNCNNYALTGLVKKYAAVPVDLGIAGDDEEELRAKLLEAASFDIIVTSGGVSVGEYDLVKKVLGDLGAETKFWKVRMKPGKPLAFGTIGGKPVFGLPGNPVSVIVSFEQFVRPAILKMSGRRRLKKPILSAVITEHVEKPTDRVHLIRAAVRREGDRYTASPTGPQGSGILRSLTSAQGLIVLPVETSSVEAGETVRVMMLDWPEE